MTRTWRTRGWQSVLAASMLAVVLVAGCGGSEGNDSSSQDDGGATGTDTGQANTASPDDSDGNDGGGSDEGIAWVPFGPDDPEDPTPTWPLYRSFADGNCSALQDVVDEVESNGEPNPGLEGMVAVCRAAVDGSEGQWAVAEERLATDPMPMGDQCLGRLVTAVMQRAIAWHKQHPGQKPTVHFQRVEGKTECGKEDERETDEPTTDEPTTDEPTSEEPSPTADESPAPDETPTDETAEPTG
jgi:hypothetical protein